MTFGLPQLRVAQMRSFQERHPMGLNGSSHSGGNL